MFTYQSLAYPAMFNMALMNKTVDFLTRHSVMMAGSEPCEEVTLTSHIPHEA